MNFDWSMKWPKNLQKQSWSLPPFPPSLRIDQQLEKVYFSFVTTEESRIEPAKEWGQSELQKDKNGGLTQTLNQFWILTLGLPGETSSPMVLRDGWFTGLGFVSRISWLKG